MCRMKLIITLLVIIFLYIAFCLASSPNRYNPTASASGGLSPDGGMRDLPFNHSPLKYSPIQYNDYEPYIYDHHHIPSPMIWEVGHWSRS